MAIFGVQLPLVGRDAELARLVTSYRSGPGSGVLLTGDAGCGKSRLLSELAGRATADGLLVLRGHAVPGGGAFRPVAEALIRAAPVTLAGDPRLAPFRSVLARLLPTWPAGTSRDDGIHLADPMVVLGEAVLELLGVLTADRRCVLLLDDLHWADQDTLALLEYVAGGMAALPVCVVAAARDDELQPVGMEALRRHPSVSVLPLPRLPAAAVVDLVRLAAGVEVSPEIEEYLVDAADGLPLLVEELFAGLVESGAVVRVAEVWTRVGPVPTRVPGAFTELVQRRLKGLEPADVAVLQAAALLGQDLDWALVVAATGLAHDVVAAGLRAGADVGLLAEAADGGLRWRHALTRDAVLSGLTSPERAVLAGGFAQALDLPVGLHGERLALVADLYARGGRPDRAAVLMLEQARENLHAGALRSARVLLERAVVLAAGHPRIGVDVAVERVHVLALGAATDEAIAVAEAALPLATTEQRTALVIAVARACVAAERFPEAGRYLRIAADQTDANVLALSAHVALGTGRTEFGLELAGAAVRAAEDVDAAETLCEALEVVGRALRRADPPASQEAFARAERVAATRGLGPWRIRALSELAISDLFTGGDGARLRQVRGLAVEAGQLGTAAVADLQLAAITHSIDGPMAFMAAAERCAATAGRLGLVGVQAHALMFVARGRVFAGRTGEADALLDQAEALAPHPVHVQSARWGVRGYEAWLTGDLTTAVRGFDRCVAVLRDGSGSNPAPVWGEWVLLRTVADPGDEGPRNEVRGSDLLVQAINVAALHYADAVAAAHTGHPEMAKKRLADGDRLLVTATAHRHLLRLMTLSRPGPDSPGDPTVSLRETLAWCDAHGELRLVRFCEDRLRELGAAIPRPSRDVEPVPPRLRALGITGRELQILRLVVAGLGNPEIAAQLHLSRRTVETHISNLLTKTGETRRAGLRTWLPA